MGACSQTVVCDEDVPHAEVREMHDVGRAPNQLQPNGDNGMNGEQILVECRSLDAKRTLRKRAACKSISSDNAG